MRSKPRRAPKERPPDPYAAGAPWRLFVALPIPAIVQSLIANITANLDAGDSLVRWTTSNAGHLTLHFLGDTDAARAELLRLSFPTFATSIPSFDIATGELGVFPEHGAPNVVWLGLSGETRELSKLHRAVGTALERFSFTPEERSFRPHITLGRLRDGADHASALALRARVLDRQSNERVLQESATIPVAEIQLVRSYLERAGARHEVIATARLKPSR